MSFRVRIHSLPFHPSFFWNAIKRSGIECWSQTLLSFINSFFPNLLSSPSHKWQTNSTRWLGLVLRLPLCDKIDYRLFTGNIATWFCHSDTKILYWRSFTVDTSDVNIPRIAGPEKLTISQCLWCLKMCSLRAVFVLKFVVSCFMFV